MRIADKMQFEQVNKNIGRNRTQMSDLQNQAASQKRVVKPSDDPLAASRVLANRIDLQGNLQFTKSVNVARSFVEYTDQSLGDLSEVLVRAKELAIGQSSDGASNEHSRRIVATEMEQLYNHMVSIGNRKLGDRFIFGGFHTQNSPFDQEGKYGGDSGEIMIHIDKETFLPMNITGARVFLGEGVSANGMVKSGPPQAKSIEELQESLKPEEPPPTQRGSATLRGPASVTEPTPEELPHGINLFHLVRDLGTALSTNDKAGIQDSLDVLDQGIEQVVLSRAQVGTRASLLDSFMQTMERAKVDNKAAISSLEDADIFSTVSDINKTQSTLQATLETSGKLIQPSLLQFLK